jgi:hypothetical protein
MTKLCSAWLGVGCFGLLALQGCGNVCGDDGFAWQQKDNPACQAQSNSETETNSNSNTETNSDSVPTEGPTESNSNSMTDTDSGNSQTDTNGGQHCADADGDGHGDPTNCMDSPFPGSVPNNDDCDDTDPDTYPGSAEKDSETACMTDADGDGYGEDNPKPGVDPGTDCDDSNPNTFPGSAENDDPMACMQDEDGDGFGDDTPTDPDVPPGSDCDDGNIFTFPGSAPLDDPDACMTDEDDDDYGDDNPGPGVDPGSDCADYDPVQHVDCTGCEPNGASCNGDNLEQCNADGTDFMVIPCEFGCDDNGEKCWDVLTVEAGPSICLDPNQAVQLDAIAMGGDGNYSWSWTPPAGLTDPMIPNPMAMPNGLTDYTINVMDGEGNMASDNVSVFVQNQALPFDPDVCQIYNFPHENVIADPDPDWQWNDQTKTLCQIVNAKASALFCGWTLDNATITGQFGVNTAMDDDWVGFMWGIQDTDHFYIFTWKQLAQTPYASCDNVDLNVPTGMQVKRISVDDPMASPLSCHDIHAPNDTANSVLLQSVDQFSTMGWQDNVQYIYELTHEADGDMTIVIRNAMNMNVVAMTNFNDTTYASGQFGMYTKSQISACFTDFKVSCL